jgi:hypothetical protein
MKIMPENAKEKNPENEKESADKKKSSPNEDEEKPSYYYDDACGYEIYVPDEDEDKEKNF